MTDEEAIRELMRHWRHVTPRDAAPALQLAGADLTILRKERDGRWVVFRAASMLVPQQGRV